MGRSGERGVADRGEGAEPTGEPADAWGQPLGVPVSADDLMAVLEVEVWMPLPRRRGGTRAALVLVSVSASARDHGCGPERRDPTSLRQSSSRVRSRGLGDGTAPPPPPPRPAPGRLGVRSGGHVMRAADLLDVAGSEKVIVLTRQRFWREGWRGCHDGGAGPAPSGDEGSEEVVAAAGAWRWRVVASCAPIDPPLPVTASRGARWTERLMAVIGGQTGRAGTALARLDTALSGTALISTTDYSCRAT
jgi:hypothetical protein